MTCFLQESLTKQYTELIPSLAVLARNLVRDIDPQVREDIRLSSHFWASLIDFILPVRSERFGVPEDPIIQA